MIIPFTTDRVKLTSGYGSRILGGKTDFHGGYDLVGVGSTDVTAAVGGNAGSLLGDNFGAMLTVAYRGAFCKK